ncbi:MAG: hypothetical protein M9927_10255 [Anaerolineae bacterium]|nr:hypothetical protein [Anaerolineae bacterium]
MVQPGDGRQPRCQRGRRRVVAAGETQHADAALRRFLRQLRPSIQRRVDGLLHLWQRVTPQQAQQQRLAIWWTMTARRRGILWLAASGGSGDLRASFPGTAMTISQP